MKPELKYRVIYRHKEKFSIIWMCKYFEVSCSGYYDWKKKIGNTDKDECIAKLIQLCHEQTKQTYGYRRVKLWLLRETRLVINHKAVLRITNKYGLLSEIRKPRPLYLRQQKIKKYLNLLNQDFSATKPNQKWVTDISYINTNQGTLYLSVIKDLHDNFIVAYDIGTQQDNALVYRTIKKAKREVADGLVLHSDQGAQYSSIMYFDLTKEYGISPSMSRPGTPLDNACAENFFGTLKTECIYRHKSATNEEARLLIDDYINFYNYHRIQLKMKLTPYEKRCQSLGI